VRVALRATVAHPDGSVPVVVAHLATDGAVRLRQAERVRALVADEDRAVVLGDFNATPTERPIETMTAAFTDAWAAAGDGLGATFPAETPSRRIDYVFLRGFRATRATVFGTADASDHRGVSATVDRG
jgi:endonuclease/exonuclease/phosphatase family metal-dependent hydrolase